MTAATTYRQKADGGFLLSFHRVSSGPGSFLGKTLTGENTPSCQTRGLRAGKVPGGAEPESGLIPRASWPRWARRGRRGLQLHADSPGR